MKTLVNVFNKNKFPQHDFLPKKLDFLKTQNKNFSFLDFKNKIINDLDPDKINNLSLVRHFDFVV